MIDAIAGELQGRGPVHFTGALCSGKQPTHVTACFHLQRGQLVGGPQGKPQATSIAETQSLQPVTVAGREARGLAPAGHQWTELAVRGAQGARLTPLPVLSSGKMPASFPAHRPPQGPSWGGRGGCPNPSWRGRSPANALVLSRVQTAHRQGFPLKVRGPRAWVGLSLQRSQEAMGAPAL